MSNSIKYQRKIISVEKKLGFLYIPAQAQEFMPSQSGKVSVFLEGDNKLSELSYNSDHKRIFGLTSWYNKHKIDAGVLLNVELTTKQIKLTVAKKEAPLLVDEDESEGIDLSGLSSGAKGNIVEDFNEILLYTTPSGKVKVEIYLQNETVWLTQQKIADLFGVDRTVIIRSNVNKDILVRFEVVELNTPGYPNLRLA